MNMDISETLEPRSDQQNYDDYIAGPKIVTVSGASRGTSEQPVNIELVEFPGRPYKPSKSMRRVIAAAWGTDASQYVGKQLKLYGDPTVLWAGKPVGGIRIEALSHIDKPLDVALTVSKGKRQKFTVHPLQEAPAPDWDDLIAQTAGDYDRLKQLWTWAQQNGADQAVLDRIQNAAQPQEEDK